MYLISPTEHDLIKLIPTARISVLCEQNGADVITRSANGLIGFQRKTILDLKASILDGRLYKELAQLTTSQLLAYSFVVIEYSPNNVTINGDFLDCTFPRKNYISILTKFHILGVGHHTARNLSDTLAVIDLVTDYCSSSTASLLRRSGDTKDAWGRSTHAGYIEYLVQSFPGVGPKLAKTIVNYFGGTLPLTWNVDVTEFLQIPGVGPKLASRLYNFFNMT